MDQNIKSIFGSPFQEHKTDVIAPGVICLTAIPYVPDSFNVIRPLSYDSANPESSKLTIKSVSYSSLCNFSNDPGKLPHRALSIKSDEDYLVYKIKKRAVLILTNPLTKTDGKGFPSHYRNTVLCAPLFTLIDGNRSYKVGYDSDIVDNIIAFKYSSIFPIPMHPYMTSLISGLMLDRIQPIHTECLIPLKPTCARLTKRWMSYLREWIRFYSTGRLLKKENASGKETVDQFLHEARSLLLEALEESRKTA